MTIRSWRDANIHDRKVLVRVDFNVPLDGDEIRDDTRIRAALPTIRELIARNNRVILVSHLGRPKGKIEYKYSLKPIATRLAELVDAPVAFAGDVVGESATALAASLQPGHILLLENVRFEPGEEMNSQDLAGKLANLADVFVNDAFGAAHRAHASTAGVTEFIPAYAGDLMISEVKALTRLLESPREGFVAIVGGAKVSDKIGVLEKLVPKVSTMIIAGGMANTFMLQQGLEVGQSLVEPDAVDEAKRLRTLSAETGTQLLLPVDLVIANSIDSKRTETVKADSVDQDQAIFDIGPESVGLFEDAIASATTIFWNGPMGVFEKPQFASGTMAITKAVAASHAFSVVGGGDSVAAIEAAGLADRISHISTGGGASLEFVEGRNLPGLVALENK